MYNKSTIIGRLGQDPDIRFTPDQKCVANLRVATSEFWRDRQTGERKEKTEWHRVVLFGRNAEIARDHLKKGSLALFEGPMRTRKWTDDADVERYVTELHSVELKLLPSSKGSNASSDSTTQNPASSSAPASQGDGYPPMSSSDFDDDDYPFRSLAFS